MGCTSDSLLTPRTVTVIDHDRARAQRVADGLVRAFACGIDIQPVFPPQPESPGHTPSIIIVIDTHDPACETRPCPSRLSEIGETPTVIVTDLASPSRALEWVLAGATETISDSSALVEELPWAVRRAMGRAARSPSLKRSLHALTPIASTPKKGRHRLHSLVEFLQSAALTDPLTGLANRRALDGQLDRLFAESLRRGTELSCLMIDVDDFKSVNDEYGHAAGDDVLVLLASILRTHSRQADIAARLGGDEFVVLLPSAGPSQAEAVAERVRAEFTQRARSRSTTPHGERDSAAGIAGDQRAGLSIGIASRSATLPVSAKELLAQADKALYAAKRAGKRRTLVFGGAPVVAERVATAV